MTQVQLEKDETSVFEKVVEDPGVCENCFERTHEVEEDWAPDQDELLVQGYDLDFYTMQGVEREQKFSDKKFHVLDEKVEKCYPERKEAKGSPKGRNVCKDCGIIDRGVKFRPVSKSEAIQYTQNLVERLEEKDIDFDEDVLFRCVRHLKERPDHQNADDDIFAAAIEVSIKYGNEDNNASPQPA